MRYKQTQHRLPSLASREPPFCATPGEALLPNEPGWVVQENKDASLLSQHPSRNSRHKQRTADRGVRGRREGSSRRASLLEDLMVGTGVSPRAADLPLKPVRPGPHPLSKPAHTCIEEGRDEDIYLPKLKVSSAINNLIPLSLQLGLCPALSCRGGSAHPVQWLFSFL